MGVTGVLEICYSVLPSLYFPGILARFSQYFFGTFYLLYLPGAAEEDC